jgi:hypothetical protein
MNRAIFFCSLTALGTGAVGDLAGDLGGQVLHVEGLDGGDAALAVGQAAPDPLDPEAERAGDAHAGDDDAARRDAWREHVRVVRSGKVRPRPAASR